MMNEQEQLAAQRGFTFAFRVADPGREILAWLEAAGLRNNFRYVDAVRPTHKVVRLARKPGGKGGISFHIYPTLDLGRVQVFFEDKEDAALFRMFWSERIAPTERSFALVGGPSS